MGHIIYYLYYFFITGLLFVVLVFDGSHSIECLPFVVFSLDIELILEDRLSRSIDQSKHKIKSSLHVHSLTAVDPGMSTITIVHLYMYLLYCKYLTDTMNYGGMGHQTI